MNNNKNNMGKKICSLTLSSVMILGTCGSAFAAPLAKLPSISDNSLVVGRHLFELDNVNSSQYNLNTFVGASKSVDENNGVYYKYNGKWYTGKDIENFNNLKNAKGLDTIPNDIVKFNGQDPTVKGDFVLDWYQDGNYSHDEDGKDESVEQFVVYLNKPVKQNKGKLKVIVPNNKGKDPYGKDKLGTIECSLDGTLKSKSLEDVEGGAPVGFFIVKDKGKNESIKEGYTDRFVIELTEDWTRILNTEKTGINYYDDIVKGLRLEAEDLEDENGNKVGDILGGNRITAKRDIKLAKDDQKPYIVAHEPIYTQIGENGIQIAGKTRILFNEPVQLLTEKNVEDMKKLNVKQPYVVGSFAKEKYIQYNPITPSQEQLKSKDQGVPVFKAEYVKINDKGEEVLDKDGKPIVVKGIYANRGDVFENDEAVEENGDKIKLRLNKLKFKYDFDANNKGITRFRDYGTMLISPEECLSEGKWQLVVKNVSDDAGNKMDDYVSEPIEITKYFEVAELTPNKVKIKFTKPFKKSSLWGNKIPVVITNDRGKSYGFTWIENIKDGQVEAEGTFAKPINNLKGIVYVNTMEYNVDNVEKPEEKPEQKPEEKPQEKIYKDGVYEGEGEGHKSTIKVKVTIKDGKMNNVDIIEAKDTKSFFDKAKAILGKILNKQTPEVDNVTGATYSSIGIKDAVRNALEKAKVPGNDNDKDENNNGDTNNGESQKLNIDWYQDGDYKHDKDGKDESVEQFVITFDKPIKSDKGTFKIIVPDKTKKDPYGADKLGEIEFTMDGTNNPKALANIDGGKEVTCFTIKNRGIIDRVVIELTEDWTRIFNTESTGINYYDDRVKGLRLVGEGLEDEKGNILEDSKGSKEITAARDIELVKDTEKPYIVTNKIIYNKIGENGFQNAGNTRIVFNEPVQILTEEMVKEFKDANEKLPAVYQGYNPLTPSQEQLKKEANGLPLFNVYYEKVDENNNVQKDESGNPIRIKGKYGLMGDIFKTGEEGDSKGDKIALRMNDVDFKFDFDAKNEGISRFRDFGSYLINPEECLTEGKWRLVVKGFSDDAGNEMDEYVSEVFNITPYFSITELTKEGIKVKFTEPFKGDKIYGDKVIIVVAKDKKMSFAWLENLKEGQTEAEGKFNAPLENLEGTFLINTMEYTVKNAPSTGNGESSNENNNPNGKENSDVNNNDGKENGNVNNGENNNENNNGNTDDKKKQIIE
ncbi:FMN-binding protein [Clostridium lundense]|uniref:FMN-binding protein n=1 Tax=Clostridium lundense TaxID=319475 RepID=UPI000686A944|nr:FMN-binding protein [Clostridium lundense]